MKSYTMLPLLLLVSILSTSVHSDVTWKLSNAKMPRAWADQAYGYNHEQIWFFGGASADDLWTRDEFIFEPSTGKFKLIDNLAPEFFYCFNQCSAQFQSINQTDFDIFIMGPTQQKEHGDNGWIYNTNTNEFDEQTFDYFPDQAEWPCTIADNTHFDNTPIVYIIGGIGEKDSHTWPIGAILAYNVTQYGGWMPNNFTSKMNDPRYAGSCILVSDYIYYFGGDDGQETKSTIERYDLLNDKWITLNATLRQKRTFHSNIYIPESNAILIIGGQGDSYNITLNSVEYFDVDTESIIESNESYMVNHRSNVVSILWNNGTIYVFGGINAETSNGTSVYDTYEIGIIR